MGPVCKMTSLCHRVREAPRQWHSRANRESLGWLNRLGP